MYPRPPSPTGFVGFSPPADYPISSSSTAHASITPHHHTMKHHHLHHPTTGMIMGVSKGASLATLGNGTHHGGGDRSDIMFPNDVDSIEFCIASSNLTMRNNAIKGASADSFSERCGRRATGEHSRRNDHKLDVQQQVKWTRKNIAATMERFEPTSRKSDNEDYPSSTQPQSQSQTDLPPPTNHLYSYAYYEPGAAKCHTNIPPLPLKDSPPIFSASRPSKSPSRNSIRALLAKSFRSKTLGGPASSSRTSEDRHTYTTRYGTTENLYEEVDQKIKKVLSDNRIVSTNSSMVKEELRRVQHNHFRVLDELNLSLEALIMPPTPPDISPTAISGTDGKVLLHHVSMENLSSTLNSVELKDHTCINPELDEGDLDSGFSGSGSSSGASYNESLRYYKTTTAGAAMHTATLPHIRSCRSSNTSNASTSNSDEHGMGAMLPLTGGRAGCPGSSSANSSPFNYTRCSESHRSGSSGTKPKKHFWTIKQ